MNEINKVTAGARPFGVSAAGTRTQSRIIPPGTTLERERSQERFSEMLALLCPDWRQASMVLSSCDGTIAYANWRCLHLLQSGNSLRSIRGRLDLCSRGQNQQFRNQLHEAANGGEKCCYFVGRMPETNRAFLVTLHGPRGRLRDLLEACFSGKLKGADVVVAEVSLGADLPDPSAVGALADAFGLSRAEAQLMQLFASGLSLRKIAACRNVTVNTARQQMKAVLSKTNCDRQQDLMRLVFSLCPGQDAASLPTVAVSETWWTAPRQ